MALILNVRSLEGLEGKGERLLKATFRDNAQTSSAASGRDSVYFGQQFKWPVGRRIEITDVLDIRVYNFSKYLANKMIGSLTISLQQLVHESSLKLREQLIDANHSTMRATLDFEINYYSPDSQIGDWRQDEFDYPVPPLRPGVAGEDQEDNASRISFSDAQSLIKENRNLLALAQGDEGGSLMTGEDDASLGNAMRKTLGVPVVLDPTLHKMEDYQLSVTIIEAKQLSGANINPCIEVRVGDRVKRTEIQMSTNSPYYNQYFPFEFHMSKSELFDQVIHIRALNKGTMMISRLFAGDLIGEFRLDVRTVYNAQDHMFFHKWACLLDPKDILGGPKGYVKCDINVIGKGEQMKSRPKAQTRKSKSNDEEDIEANLLLPSGVSIKRQNAEISVRIYRAEDLPKMNTDFMATIKQAITGDSKPLADPYVQVSFAGHFGKTKSKKNTYDPQWNEAVVFTEMFPPLCNRVRISVYDWDTVYNECIATHFIDLNQIMNDAESGFMPTFGPSWINLYGTPRSYSYENMIHPKEELNLGLGEGVAYRGRLLMAIKTEVKTDNSGLTSGARVASTHPVPDTVAGKKEDFLLVGVIYEAGAIDAEIGKKLKPLSFELSIGTYGNRIDGNFNEGFEDDEEETDPNRKKILPMWCHSVSHAMTPSLTQNEYYHVPFNEKKPCLYMRCNYEDHRPRMFIPNILEKLYSEFEMEIEEMQELVHREKRGVLKRLQRALQTLLDNLEKASLAVRSCRGSAGKTLLDMQRQKTIRVQLEKMKIKAKTMRSQLISSDNVSGRLKECRALVKLLRDLSVDPQHALPDVFVWLIADGQRLAFARIPARQILHSLSEEERGKDCGKVVTLFLRKPGRKGMGQGGWSLQCQLKMYLWLGLLKDIKHYRTTVPEGYVVDTFKYRRPPNEIVYTEKSYFEFRAYLFMARNLIGSDESGLSDAFARIIINDQVVTTHVIEESLSPMWDRTMIVSPVVFYLNEVTVQEHPPVIVVEIFDEDQVTSVLGGQQTASGKSEFLGRCFCKPLVTLYNGPADTYRPPRLDWWEIYRGQLNAGELLAAFELIQLDGDKCLPDFVPTADDLRPHEIEVEEGRQPEFIPVPPAIRPNLAHYRIEILFWGVRELAKIQFQSVESPKVTMEFGGKQLPSDMIESCKSKPNFPNNIKCLDLMLPENRWYWPPLMFQCEDCRQFGRTVLVGNHVIASVLKYIRRDETEKKDGSDEEPTAGPLSATKSKPSGSLLSSSRLLVGRAPASLLANGDGSAVDFMPGGGGAGAGPSSGSAMMIPTIPGPSGASRKASQASSARFSPALPPLQQHMSSGMSAIGSCELPTVMVAAQPGDIRLEDMRPPGEEQHHPGPSSIGPISSPEASPAHHAGADRQPLMGGRASGVGSDGRKLGASGRDLNLDLETRPGGPVELKLPPKKKPPSKDDLQDLDWWSRFYATIDDLEDQDEDDEESNDDVDILKDIDVEIKSEADDKAGLVEIPEGDEEEDDKKKKKKKKKGKKDKKDKKKKKKKPRKLPFKKDARAEYLAEKDDELSYEVGQQEDNSWISRIKIYQNPLEEVKDFGGFEQTFKSFPVYRGKQEDDDEPSESRVVGTFKGNICIYQISESEFRNPVEMPSQFVLYKDLPSNDPISVLVRIYVIRCIDLHPADPNGKSDPYLLIHLGGTTINEKENYIPKQLNPVFGKCFEIDAKFPQESNLQILVMDWDMLSGDDLIGETKIDLENRFFSKHRATCGLPLEYASCGYNKWRDQQPPSVILSKLCRDFKLEPPKYEPNYNRVTVNGITFYEHVEIEDETGKKTQSNEPLALKVLNNWDSVTSVALVPEHIETRPLFTPEKPGIEQGRVEMWVDMFPKELGVPPAPLDITPRKPMSYELRVIIWDTEEVKLNDTGITGEASSDIFVKGWMKGLSIDDQVTDVHYRSLTGEGNFNWRFVFEFDYLKAEDKIVYKVKDSPFAIDEEEKKAMCKLYLQVWDADIVSSDDFLGGLDLTLSKIPRGAKSAKACDSFLLEKESNVKTFSIFRNKRCRGWWPFIGESEDDPNEKELGGKVDAELQLLTAAEAEANPAGLGRGEPQPLPPPNRPETSFLSILNPLKAIKYLVCVKYKWLLIKLLIITLLAAILVLFIYSSPGYLAKRLMGA